MLKLTHSRLISKTRMTRIRTIPQIAKLARSDYCITNTRVCHRYKSDSLDENKSTKWSIKDKLNNIFG